MIPLKEGGVKGDDLAYDLFLIIVVPCIDIYADHCIIVRCVDPPTSCFFYIIIFVLN